MTSEEKESAAKDYTKEQEEAVKKIRACKSNQDILGLSRDASQEEIRKVYLKLAHEFHPDKNKAPGAEEAFKAIGNAYKSLKDPTSKEQAASESESAPQRDEAFDNFKFWQEFFEEQRRQAEEIQRQQEQDNWFSLDPDGQSVKETEGYLVLFRQVGILLSAVVGVSCVVLGVFFSMQFAADFVVESPWYNLERSNVYSVRKTTNNLGIHYYVRRGFKQKFTGSLRQKLENSVEKDFFNLHLRACNREKQTKDNLDRQAKLMQKKSLFQKAEEYEMYSCTLLKHYYNY